MKKYKLTEEKIEKYGRILHRIESLKDFGNVKKGDKGGWVESEGNLSQEGECWAYDDAEIYGHAEIFDDARIYGYTKIYGHAEIYGHARISEHAKIYGYAEIYEHAEVYGCAEISNYANIKRREDICSFGYFGRAGRYTTFVRDGKTGVSVVSGCFVGSLKQFEEAVKETHGNSQYGEEYKAIIKIVRIRFGIEDK